MSAAATPGNPGGITPYFEGATGAAGELLAVNRGMEFLMLR